MNLPDRAGEVADKRPALHLPLFYEDAPELADPYVRIFEKVWARKDAIAQW